MQYLAQELFRPFLARVRKELVGRRVLDDLATVQKDNAVRGRACASSSIASSTSPIISGSRAEVGSSKSISVGFIARARTMAARGWPGKMHQAKVFFSEVEL